MAETKKKMLFELLGTFLDDLKLKYFTPMSTDISNLKNRLDNTTSTEYSESKTYAVGDYCIYNNQLYECVKAITTPKKWSSTDWKIVDIKQRLMPKGGNTGQVLSKSTNDDFKVEWKNDAAGADGAIIDDNHITSSTAWSSNKIANEILNKAHPIGSIYISMNSTNPGTIIGGTWTRLQDRFLLAASGTTGTYPLGSTGGERTHTLTQNETPKHTHSFSGNRGSTEFGVNPDRIRVVSENGGCTNSNHITGYQSSTPFVDHDAPDNNVGGLRHMHYFTPSGSNSYYGGSAAHNNMPPYIAVYMWQRTA